MCKPTPTARVKARRGRIERIRAIQIGIVHTDREEGIPVALVDISNSHFHNCAYDPKEDTVYYVRWVRSLPKKRYAMPTYQLGNIAAFFASFFLAILAIKGCSSRILTLTDLLLWVPILWMTVKNERRYQRIAGKWDKIVLRRARGRQLRELVRDTRIIYSRYDLFRYYWAAFLFFAALPAFVVCLDIVNGIAIETEVLWLLLSFSQAALYSFLLQPRFKRRLFVKRLKEMLAEFEKQHNMDTAACVERIKVLFPAAAEIYDSHIADYRSLDLGLFAVEAVTIPFGMEVTDKRETSRYGDTCQLIEDMWFHGDDIVYDALRNLILPHLAEDAHVWERFTAGISEDFYRDIYADLLPESPRLYEQLEKDGLLFMESV